MQDPAIPGDIRARISARLGYGEPHTVLLVTADEVGADLIALGTHGRSGFMPTVIGSMAEILLSCVTATLSWCAKCREQREAAGRDS